MMYLVRPTMGHYVVYEPYDTNKATIRFEGTQEECYKWVSEQMNKEWVSEQMNKEDK